MKTRLLMAVVIALSGIATVGSAFADSYSEGPAAVSSKTRAEVKAEWEQARAGGLMNSGEHAYIFDWARPNMGAMGVAGSRYSGRTREEVKAELEQTRTEGLMNSGEHVNTFDWARPEWIRPNR